MKPRDPDQVLRASPEDRAGASHAERPSNATPLWRDSGRVCYVSTACGSGRVCYVSTACGSGRVIASIYPRNVMNT